MVKTTLNTCRSFLHTTHAEKQSLVITRSFRFSKASGISGFMQREVISRIIAIASCGFSLLLLLPKVALGLWDLGTGTLNALQAKKWNFQVLNKIFIKHFYHGLLFSCGALIRLPIALIQPDILLKNANMLPKHRPQCMIRDDLQIDHQKVAQTQLESMTERELDANWRLNDFFGSIRFINLDRSADRRASMVQQLESIGLRPDQYERHTACDGRASLPKECYDRVDSNYKHISTATPEGRAQLDRQHQAQAGCYMSHYTLIKDISEKYTAATERLAQLEQSPDATPSEIKNAKAMVQQYSSVLIFEDDDSFGTIDPEDITIPDGKNRYFSDKLTTQGVGTIFREAMRDLPKDWDMLYFMSLHYSLPETTHSPFLAKLRSAVGLTGYAVHARMYPILLKHLSKIDDPQQRFLPIDDEVAQLHAHHECYVITPPIVAQPGEESVINGIVQSANPQKKYWQCS